VQSTAITTTDTYAQRIYKHALNVREPHLLEFRHLQRINLSELQNQLASQKAEFAKSMSVSTSELLQLRETLHSYATAIRDYEYLMSLPQITGSEQDNRRKDLMADFPSIGLLPTQPYNSRYHTFRTTPTIPTDPLRDLLKSYLPRRLTWTRAEMKRHIGEFIERKPPQDVSPFVDSIARLILAFAAGASLVVPVVIMSLNKSVPKSLITTSVAVLIFAVALAFGVKASNTETLAATATYAAVLVVFVGTSGP